MQRRTAFLVSVGIVSASLFGVVIWRWPVLTRGDVVWIREAPISGLRIRVFDKQLRPMAKAPVLFVEEISGSTDVVLDENGMWEGQLGENNITGIEVNGVRVASWFPWIKAYGKVYLVVVDEPR
jgi:hypothetical protein